MRAGFSGSTIAVIAVVTTAGLCPGAATAAFPGGNGLIAFSGRLVGPERADGIFTIHPDGSELRQVTDATDDPLAFDEEPSWSADGRRLVFTRSVYGSETDRYTVFTIDADGGDRTQVVDIGRSRVSPDPSFSPSGRRIVYTAIRALDRVRPRHGSIQTIRTNGTKPRRLLRGFLSDAQYSPSGKRIVFAGTPKGKNRSGIWTIRRDGSRLRRLTDPGKVRLRLALRSEWICGKRGDDLRDTAPDYSPDGRRIVVRHSLLPRGCDELGSMRADGSRERPISGTAAAAGTPAYAPAGDRIALSIGSGIPGSCSDIYTISPTGSDRQNVTSNCDESGIGGTAGSPSWQPVRWMTDS